jgi:hypothetical protein
MLNATAVRVVSKKMTVPFLWRILVRIRILFSNLSKISLATRVPPVGRGEGAASERNPLRPPHARRSDRPAVQQEWRPSYQKAYRTHYVSPELRERKQQKLEERLGHAPQPVVFAILRESRCFGCGTELAQGDFLYMEAGQAVCLACANMGDLEFLPAGDTALTRRAGKDSARPWWCASAGRAA